MPQMQDQIHPTMIGAVITCKRAAAIFTKNPLHLLPDACGKQRERKAAIKVPRPGTMLSIARGMATKSGRTGRAFLNTPGFSSTSRISPPNSAASLDVYTFPVSAFDMMTAFTGKVSAENASGISVALRDEPSADLFVWFSFVLLCFAGFETEEATIWRSPLLWRLALLALTRPLTPPCSCSLSHALALTHGLGGEARR